MASLAVLLLMVPTVWFSHGSLTPHMEMRPLLMTLLSGALGISLADTLYFRALNELGAGRMGIIGNLFSPSVISLAYLFLGERMSPLQFAGFALVLGGVLLVHAGGIDKQHHITRKGLLLGVAAVLLNAAGIVMIKPVLATEAFFSVALLRMSGALLIMLLLWPLFPAQFRMPAARQIPWKVLLLGAVVGQYLAMLFWLAGYKFIVASVASILNETASIFILLFAAMFLGEKLTRHKLAGVVLSFGGVALMLWA